MKIKQYTPGKRQKEAFGISDQTMGAFLYGLPGKERIDLWGRCGGETQKKRGRKKGARLKAGYLELSFDGGKEAWPYQRSLDRKTGIARTSYEQAGRKISSLAFASRKHGILVYELKASEKIPELTLRMVSNIKGKQAVYQIGGFFLAGEMPAGEKKAALCVKGALYTDGFPEAAEESLRIKNVSRAALYIMMEGEHLEEETLQEAVLRIQMGMNRRLVKVEDTSFEGILAGQKEERSF